MYILKLSMAADSYIYCQRNFVGLKYSDTRGALCHGKTPYHLLSTG